MNDAVKAVLVAAGLFLAWRLSSVLLLVFASILFAVGLQAVARYIEKKTKWGMNWSFATLFIFLLVISVAFILVAVPSFSSQYHDFSESFPQQVQSGISFVNEQLGTNISTDMGDFQLQLKPSSFFKASDLIGSAFGIVADFFILVIITIYLAINPRDYELMLKRLPKKRREHFIQIKTDLQWWLAGKFLSMLIIFALTTISLMILGVQFALLLGFIAGVLSFIPNLGPILALIPAAIIGLSQSPVMALYVILLYTSIQLVESYLLTPQIDRRTVSLSPAFQLISQLVFGVLFGFMGLFLAVPLVITLRTLFMKK